MRRLLWVLWVSGCGGSASEHPGTDASVARSCVVTATGSTAEQLVVELLETRPVTTERSRDGVLSSRWTYAYDEHGRLVRQAHDWRGTTTNGPDGTADRAREIVHDATSAVESWIAQPPVGEGERATYVLDESDRVLMYTTESSETSFDLDAMGRLVRVDEEAVDVDLGPYTRLTEYIYEGDRLASRSVVDSRAGTTPRVTTYQHELTANRLVVRWANRSYAYTYDAGNRVTRAEVDEDGDGASDWVVEATYAGDGAATIVSMRDATVFRTHVYSDSCGFTIELPTGPSVRRRPGAHWNYLHPAVPSAYD